MEDQNYGRAGRKGQRGSYSLIFKYLADINNPLLTVESIKQKREENEKKKFESFKLYDEKNMIEEEKLFDDYCKFRKDTLKKADNEFIKEDNEYQWGKIINSKDSFENKKQSLELLKKNTNEIINPLIKIKYFIDNIYDFKETDEKIFEEEDFYSWPLKMVYANELASDKKLKKAKEYYDDAIDNLISFQSDIQNQTFLGMFIFKSKKKMKILT